MNQDPSKMKELKKYSINGSFTFFATDQLSQVCNAPGKEFCYGGIYIIYAEKKGISELVYIGISGRIDKKTHQLVPRKDGIKGRIVNGKRDGEPRKNYWIREMYKEKIDYLKFYWFVVHNNDSFQDSPEIVEKNFIDKYKPRWNRT